MRRDKRLGSPIASGVARARARAARVVAAAATTVLAITLPAAAGGQPVQQGNLRVAAVARLRPHALPRTGTAPIGVSIAGRVSTVDGSPPPQLQTIRIALNRHGRLDYTGLPVCHMSQIQPSPTRVARTVCGSSLVGEGHFSANVVYPQQAPFPSDGRLLAFNSRIDGDPAILVHIYGTSPIPISNTLVFKISRSRGSFGVTLTASLPRTTGEWGFVTGISLTLSRRFGYRGQAHSYLSAGCPAPEGFSSALFPLTRTSFSFAGGRTLAMTLTQTCRVR